MLTLHCVPPVTPNLPLTKEADMFAPSLVLSFTDSAIPLS
eukprot:CAMPEP_0172706110 /NCGR_PEP_ID=MMETSP1074-20121228/45800_1 /TAXON_ID=2916 /ORGANISM="Ceratium fusus, Strain PA161109" /LENGTH=39 /DNA_ID= /DNA_START= /DNA_END= /DNA_ORIENTATION=